MKHGDRVRGDFVNRTRRFRLEFRIIRGEKRLLLKQRIAMFQAMADGLLAGKRSHGLRRLGGMLEALKAKLVDGELEFKGLIAKPDGYIAQPTLALSVCPTYVESGIAPRHLDLVLQRVRAEQSGGRLTWGGRHREGCAARPRARCWRTPHLPKGK